MGACTRASTAAARRSKPEWCRRTRGWQGHIRYLSGGGVVRRLCTPIPLRAQLPQCPVSRRGQRRELVRALAHQLWQHRVARPDVGGIQKIAGASRQ